MTEYFNLALLALGLMTMLTTFAWIVAIRIRFFSLIDVVWSYSFALVAFTYAYLGSGWEFRRLGILIMASVWSYRLGTYLFLRLKSHYPTEDGRYTTLRSDWAENLNTKFLFFFVAQGLSVVFLSYPFLVVSQNIEITFHWTEYLAMAVWLLGISGEALADHQLTKFKQDPNNRGKTCRSGLWRYTRHPNYFFDWLVWVSFFIYAVSSDYGWISIISPIIMLYLFFRVTGIPATESQAIKTKGDDYINYQKETSSFFPWLPKKIQS